MATLTAINEAGASLGDTWGDRPIIRIIADTNYVYGEKGVKRNAEPLDIAAALTTADIIRYTVPAAGGPFVTGPPQSNVLADDAEVLLSPLAPIPANTLTDPMTIADVLLFTEVSESELASGALRRVTITASDVAFADETYNVDYSVFEEQLFESEIYTVNDRTLTFDAPVVHSPKKTLIHRVFINANTADSTIKFAPGTWKTFGTADDATDILVPNGENKTLEFTSNKAGEDFVRVLGKAVAISAGERIYENAADQSIPNALVNTYATDLPVLAVGDTITVIVARGVRVYELTSRYIGEGYVYDHEMKGLEWTTEIVGSQLRLQAVAGGGTQAVKAIFIERKNATVDAQLPTSFVNLGDWNGVNLQNAVTNGMLIGGGFGPAGTGAPSGAFTGSCKVTTIGDWCQQDFLTGNAPGTVVGERFSRQSFNATAGAGNITWTGWFGQ